MREIGPERPGEEKAICAIHRAAFGGDYEAGVVATLRADGDALHSLVAREDGVIVGHVMFSRLDARIADRRVDLVVLAPLAVDPRHHHGGVGSALVRAGLARLREDGCEAVVVRGHPTYYPRFGFSAALAERLDAPWSGPTYMAIELKPGVLDGPTRCRVVYPRAFKLP